jgi:hypothetical protein
MAIEVLGAGAGASFLQGWVNIRGFIRTLFHGHVHMLLQGPA